MGREPAGGSGDYEQLLRHQYEEVWANANLDVLEETCSHDLVLYGLPTTDRSADIQAFREFVESCCAAFSDLSNDIEDVVADDDRVVVRSRLCGTHDGNRFLDAEPTGCDVEVGLTTTFRLERGEVAEAWMCFDTMGLLQQVGAIPEHPQAYDWGSIDE